MASIGVKRFRRVYQLNELTRPCPLMIARLYVDAARNRMSTTPRVIVCLLILSSMNTMPCPLI